MSPGTLTYRKKLAFSTAHAINTAANIMNKAVVFGLGCLGIIVIGLIFFGLAIAGGYNGLVSSSTTVDGSWAQVQTQYQRRADLIPNLVRTVEGAANFEKSTLTDVINARANATKVTIDPSKAPTDPEQLRQFEQSQNALSGTLSRLLVVSEKYPELKANTNFRDLQAQIEGTENRIAVARRDFNNTVQGYNAKVRSFPTVIYAGWFGFQAKPYFQSSAGSEAAPNVSFPSLSPSASPK
jgi:LemA protein